MRLHPREILIDLPGVDHEKVAVECETRWPGDPRAVTTNRFPIWGDQSDLVSLIVNPAAGGGRSLRLLPAVTAELDGLGVRYAVEQSRSLADARQRVIFGENRDHGAAVPAEICDIGCLQSERFALHRQSMRRDRIRKPSRGLEFLERELRLLVDRVTEFEKFGTHRIDRRGRILLQRFDIHETVSPDG